MELEVQVREGLLPEPAVIAVPVGSMGTAAGLLAGLSFTNLRSRIFAVVVNDLLPISGKRVCTLADRTLRLLAKSDPSIRTVKVDPARLDLSGRWMGKGYGHLEGPVLFWHTFNSRPLPPLTLPVDFSTLPEALWKLLEKTGGDGLPEPV